MEVDVPHHLLAVRRRHAAVVPHAHEARTAVAAGFNKSDLSLGNGFVNHFMKSEPNLPNRLMSRFGRFGSDFIK